MAKVMSFTDQYGETSPQSYWRIVLVNRVKEDRTANLVFYGFTNESQKGKRIIGQKSYTVSGEDFDTWFSPSVLSPEGINPESKAYEYAVATKDVDSGGGNMVSFFEGAHDV